MERTLVLCSLLAVLAALGLTASLLARSINSDLPPASTLGQVFERNLVSTWVTTGMLLIVGWPVVLRVAAGVLNTRFHRPERFLMLLAVLLGALTYVLTFLPGSAAAAALLVPLVLSPILFRRVLRLSWGPIAQLWAAQSVGVAALLSITLWGIESLATGNPLNPVRELPIIMRLAQRPALPPQHILPTSHGSAFPPLRWGSSGSRWLDLRANQAQVVAINPERSADWGISLHAAGEGGVIEPSRHSGNPWISTRFTPEPDVPYIVAVETGVLPGDLLLVYSLLPMTIP